MACSKETALKNMKKARAAKTTPGRKPGSKNKLKQNLVEEIIGIHEQLKKEKKGLLECARQNPKWFCERFLVAIIPKNVDLNFGQDSVLKVIFERVKVSDK